MRAVYCSIDPSTAILDVHKGFRSLDTVPHVLTAAVLADISAVHVVDPASIPSAGQQSFGDDLLRRHRFVAIPSAVSAHGWNLVFVTSAATGAYALKFQEAFALDTRLHPPST